MSAPYEAWWLPGFTPGPDREWWEIPGDGVVARAPRLNPNDLSALTGRLRAARREYLVRLSVDDLAARIGAATNRWLDPFSPYLHLACTLIPRFTGYPEPAVRKGLAGYLGSFRTENLRRLLVDELGDPEVLDSFRPRPAGPGLTRAIGPGLVVHSFAGNVPGLPAQSLVAATLVKAASMGKVAADEPVFASLFLRSLAEVDPRLAECLAVTYWPGGESSAAFARADAVVAYGSEQTIQAIRAALAADGAASADRRLIAYGHKLSFGVLTRERLNRADLPELAERAAYDVARYDQQGCLSPHLFYVEEGGALGAGEFAAALGEALARWSDLVPRGQVGAAERARVAEARRTAEFRAATRGGAVFGTARDDWRVVYDPDPAFEASCLNRTVWVKSLANLRSLPDLLAPVRRYLQTAGVAVDDARRDEVANVLAEVGIDRICPLGQMGDPPITWHHDGRFNLLDFLRFTDLEPENASGRWEFAHPDQGVLGKV